MAIGYITGLCYTMSNGIKKYESEYNLSRQVKQTDANTKISLAYMRIYSSINGTKLAESLYPHATKDAYGEIYLQYNTDYLTYKLFSTTIDNSFSDIYNVKYPTPNDLKTSTYYHFDKNPKVKIKFITLFTPSTDTDIENLTYIVNNKEYTTNTKNGEIEFFCKPNTTIEIPNDTNFGKKSNTLGNSLKYKAKMKLYKNSLKSDWLDLSTGIYENDLKGGNGFYILDGDVKKTITKDTEFTVAILPKYIYLSPAYVGNSIDGFIKKGTYANLYTISSGNNEGISGTWNGGNSGAIDKSQVWGAGTNDRDAGDFAQMYATDGYAATSEYRYRDRGKKEARRFGVTPIIMSLFPRKTLITSSPSQNLSYNGTSFGPLYNNSIFKPLTAGAANPSHKALAGIMVEKGIVTSKALSASVDINDYQQNISDVSAYWLPRDGYEYFDYRNPLNNFSYSTLLYGETSKSNRGGQGVWTSPHLWNGPYNSRLKEAIGINDTTEHKYLQHQVLIGSASGGSGEDRDHQVVFEFSTITVGGICAECYFINQIDTKSGLNNPNIQENIPNKGFIIGINKNGGQTGVNEILTGLFRINTLDMTDYEKSKIKSFYNLS